MKPFRDDDMNDLADWEMALLGIGLLLGLIVTSIARVPARAWRWIARRGRGDE